MGDEYTETVDTSSDMDTSDDSSDDSSEDVSADSNDIADDIPEDISEDVPEDSSSDSDDMADDIPEDIPEDVPEDFSSDSDDMADDIPDDIPEDVPEDSSADSDDIADDIPDDVPEDSSADSEDIADDIPEDIPEDVPEDSSADSDDITDDIPDDIPEDAPEDSSADSDDIADNISEDIPEDVPADTQNDISNEVSSNETEDTASDVSSDEQPTDTQDDMDDDSSSDETEDTTSDISGNEQSDGTQNDMDDDSFSDKNSDTASDTSGDEQPDDTQNDVTDETSSDETGDTDSDASADTKGRCPKCGKPIDQCVCKDNEVNEGGIGQCPKCGKPIDQCICTNEEGDDTISSDNSPNDDIERNTDTQEDEFRQLSDYMNEHNYGREDFAAYSQDPEWQRLHSKAYPDYIPPETSSADTQEDAFRQLSDYMNEHNYGREDFAAYSQDPKWQRLHSNAYPDYTPPEEISEDIVSDASVDVQGDMTDGDSKSDISQDTNTMSAEISEVAFNQELSKEFKENILSDPELTPEQKELMLGSFDKVNRSDINDKTGEVQTGNLMSDMLKPSQVDNMDSVSEMQESSSFIHAMEISNSVIDRYEKVRNNTALLNDETGYQIAMNEMRKDLEKQVSDIDLAIAENDTAKKIAEENLRNYSPEMEVSTLSDSKYRELVENLQNTRAQSNQLRSQRNYLESLQNEASTEISDEFKGISFISPVRKSFSDTFSELINEQGAAYPDEIVNDCGVCTMGNLANQHGGKYTERSGLSTGFGEYDYIQITEDMLPDEKIYALEHNGLTSLDSQAKILNKMGYEAVKYENGASFDEIVDNISKGNSMSLNLYGGDLNSGSDIAKRPGRIAAALSSQQAILPANHAVTIAGLAVNPSGKPIGFFVNDTGGYGGNNNPSIFVSKAKYKQMMKRTVGISSIVCTGKKAFV